MTPDEVAMRVAATAISDFLKASFSGLQKVASRVARQLRVEDPFGLAASRYARLLFNRHSTIKILGMPKPVQLVNLYTDVHLLGKIPSRQHAETVELTQFLETRTGVFIQDDNTVPAIDAVDKNDRLVVLGRPGAGKTTLLRHIVMREIQSDGGLQRLPVFVSLHEIATRKLEILESTGREFAEIGLEGPEYLQHLLQTGKAFLLLDGLDEVGSEDTPRIIQEIVDTCARFPKSKVIVTCRTAVYSSWLENFVDVEIADFSPSQIRTFVFNWFSEVPQRADTCWQGLQERPNIFQLATTPLLLALVCISYEATASIADTRADLYKDAIDVLLRKWDSSRLIYREQRYRALSPSRKETLLSFLAAQMFNDERYFFKYEAARDAICSYVLHLEDINEDDAREDAAAMLNAIEGQHGILVTRAKGVFSFAHLTFQEYFTALFLSRTDDGLREAIVDKHLEDPRWREVLILIAHLLPAADEYVAGMLKKLCSIGVDRTHYRELVSQMRLLRTETPSIEGIFREPRGRRPMVASSEDRTRAKRILERILRIVPSPKLVFVSLREALTLCLVGQKFEFTTAIAERPLTEEEKEIAKRFRETGSGSVHEYSSAAGTFPVEPKEAEEVVANFLDVAVSLGFGPVDVSVPTSFNMISRNIERLIAWHGEIVSGAVAQLSATLPQNVGILAALQCAKERLFRVREELEQARVAKEPSGAAMHGVARIGAATDILGAERGKLVLDYLISKRRETSGAVERQAEPVADEQSAAESEDSTADKVVLGKFGQSAESDYVPPQNLLRAAAVLAEILSTPVFLRKETRRAALETLMTFPFEPPRNPEPGGPDGPEGPQRVAQGLRA